VRTILLRSDAGDSVDLDEDALSGALLGRVDPRFPHTAGHVGEPLGRSRVLEDLVTFLHVGETVVEQREHVGSDLFAEAVAGAEVLVDPDLHGGVLSSIPRSYVAGVSGVTDFIFAVKAKGPNISPQFLNRPHGQFLVVKVPRGAQRPGVGCAASARPQWEVVTWPPSTSNASESTNARSASFSSRRRRWRKRSSSCAAGSRTLRSGSARSRNACSR